MAFLRKRGSELPPGRCAYNYALWLGLSSALRPAGLSSPWQCRPTWYFSGNQICTPQLVPASSQIFSSLVRVLSDRAQGRGSHAGCACLKKQPLLLQILLNYLPPERKAWKDLLEQKRAAYKQFRQELIIDPKKQEASAAADHPLSQSSSSKWNAFFKVGFYSWLCHWKAFHAIAGYPSLGPGTQASMCVHQKAPFARRPFPLSAFTL